MAHSTAIIEVSSAGAPVGAQVPSQPHKNVQFRWQQARLPLRVRIKPHDSAESIISTVKNFYGLYEGEGISFEDDLGVSIIPHYENLRDQTTVDVRVIPEQVVDEQSVRSHRPSAANSPRKPTLDEPFQLQPVPSFARPDTKQAWGRSVSPSSQAGSRNGGSRSQTTSRPRAMGALEDDVVHGLSDSDAEKSVSSSRRGKNDLLASAEISVDNIVEGGRRKRAKFESSELPLFIPPQLPITASMSSASPQRRAQVYGASPQGAQGHFPYALPSPYSYGSNDHFGPKMMGSINGRLSGGWSSNGRASGGRQSTRLSGNGGTGVLPTPDPTTGGSVISDEDVALQLMRLGDASNISHGRTSTSTLDDALSGVADAPSCSEGSEDESDRRLPLPKQPGAHHAKKKLKALDTSIAMYDHSDSSEDEYEDFNDGSFKGESDEIVPGGLNGAPRIKSRKTPKSAPAGKTPKVKVPKQMSSAGSRKGSAASMAANFAHDEEDLSSRPRCQRCRKSKKGCDRQRPCGRCVDAGIGIEGCISEEEENGRRGRYGRHMGVAVKKQSSESAVTSPTALYPVEPILAPALPYADDFTLAEKMKKRKR